MTGRKPWRRCPACGGQTRWLELGWWCTRCQREFTRTDDPKFAPPGRHGPLIATCSYTEFGKLALADQGWLGVRTSLGIPRWIKRDEPWPYVSEVTPRASYLQSEESRFLDAYLAQLRSYGVDRIRDAFVRVAAGKTDRLVLLCFEQLPKGVPCHRRYFAAWWDTATGEEVPELGELPTHEQLTLFGEENR